MQVDVGLNFWLTQWNWQPTLLFGAALAIILYFYAIGPVREKYFPNETISTSQGAMFLLGVNTIFLSLVSPLDKLGDTYLFSAHMVQHLILTLVGPPLLSLGIPGWLIQPVMRNALRSEE